MSKPSIGLVCILLLASCDDDNNNNNDGGVVTLDSGTSADVSVSTGDTGVSTGDTGVAAGDTGAAGDVMMTSLTPTFTQVYAIITSRCAPCHTTATGIGVSQGHLDMTTKAAAFMNLVNAPTAGVQCAGKGTRVTPGDEATSIMYLKVSLDDPTPCGAKMPLGLPALSQAETDTIENWIKGGAPNN